ncbi:MAG: hypothetical protein R3C19_22820 [Planctomycetaceae bacterium]
MSELTSIDESLELSRLTSAIMLCSLDFTVPFHDVIGLDRVDSQQLVSGLRDFIRVERTEQQHDFDAVLVRVARVFDFLAERSADPGGVFRKWFTEIYCQSHHEYPALEAWTNVLRKARRDSGDWKRLCVPAAIQQDARERFDRSVNADEFDARTRSAGKPRLSDWDLHLYAINLWNDDLPDIPNGPESQLYPIFCRFQGARFWWWLSPLLSNEERRQLVSGANQLISNLPDLAYIGSLRDLPSAPDIPAQGTGYA